VEHAGFTPGGQKPRVTREERVFSLKQEFTRFFVPILRRPNKEEESHQGNGPRKSGGKGRGTPTRLSSLLKEELRGKRQRGYARSNHKWAKERGNLLEEGVVGEKKRRVDCLLYQYLPAGSLKTESEKERCRGGQGQLGILLTSSRRIKGPGRGANLKSLEREHKTRIIGMR